MKFPPGEDRPDVHEPSKIEKDVQRAVYLVVSLYRFFQVQAVPVEGISGNEARKQVVGAERTTYTDDEKLETSHQYQLLESPETRM